MWFEEYKDEVARQINMIIREEAFTVDEFELVAIAFYGSQTTGKATEESDLDVLVEYKGTAREDGLMYTDSKPKLLERLVKGEGEIFADDLQLLIGNHMVDKVSIEGLLEVIQSLRYFSEAPLEEKFVEEHDNDGRLVGFEDFSRLMIKMQCLDANEVLVDEAIYATGNIKTAVKEYLSRRAYVKRIGLLADTKEIYLYR